MAKILVEETTGEVINIPEEVVSKEWYRRPANYVIGQFDKDMEKGGGKSLTVPNESYTIREILEKFTRGLPLDVEKEGYYENPEEIAEGFENAIDITDVEEQSNILNSKIAEAKQSKVKGVVKGAEVKPPDITEVKKVDEASKT